MTTTTATTTTQADMLLPGDEVRLIPGGGTYVVRLVIPAERSIHRAPARGYVCLMLNYWEGGRKRLAEIVTPSGRLVEVVKWADD